MAILDVLLGAMPAPLLLYWSLCTLAAVSALFPSLGWSGFRDAVVLSSCRGKLWSKKAEGLLGPLKAARVPQAWFGHFYMVGVLCALSALVLLFVTEPLTADLSKRGDPAALLAMLCLLFHLSRRLLESVCLMRYPKDAYMHLIAYTFGLSYYIALPFTLLPTRAWKDLAWQDVQGLAMQGFAGNRFEMPSWRPLALAVESLPGVLTPIQALGVVVFIAGNALQCHSHWILAGLRAKIEGKREDGLQTTEDGYALPRGGAFSVVSCPHYLGEIVIYGGLVLMLGGSNIGIWIVLAWVVSNLMLAAGPTHEWYKQRFAAYPRERRALIPWLY